MKKKPKGAKIQRLFLEITVVSCRIATLPVLNQFSSTHGVLLKMHYVIKVAGG
jgi:hypothetical protein